MAITDAERIAAEARLQDDLKGQPKAVTARYDRRVSRIVVELDNGLELAFPPRLAEGLEAAAPAELSEIEISPLGDGLYWPSLDVDLHVPGLLLGVFGSKAWMAKALGAAGGSARSARKANAARENGRKGGRPKRVVTA